MYAYCANNPAMYTDATGNSWDSFWNDVNSWFVEKIINPVGCAITDAVFWTVDTIAPENDINTIQLGFSFFAGCGFEYTFATGYALDREGNFGKYITSTIPGTGACIGDGVSLGLSLSFSNAQTINDLAGRNVNVGASAGVSVYGVSIGIGVDWSKSLDNGYTTWSGSCNIGVGKIPFEGHASLTYTWIIDTYSFREGI